MSRTAHFGESAQKALIDGLNYVANAVKTTAGPAGKTVIIQRNGKTPFLTKDGITVAKNLSPKDEKVKLGADLAISIAQKQMDTVGDGTTTATVLGQALVNAGIKQLALSENTINRTAVKRGMEKARDYVISKLDTISTKDISSEDLIKIATISANGDEKLGKIVADAYSKVGKNGVVTVEETKERDIRLVFKEGMTFNQGWTSQYFITDDEKQLVEYDNARILLCNSKITNFNSIVKIIQPILTNGEAVVIIAEGFDTMVTQALVMNRLRSNLKVACIEAPGFGDNRLEILRDMAAYLNTTVANDPNELTLDAMSSANLGFCEKIIIKKDETIIRESTGNKEALEKRINIIKGLIKATKDSDQWQIDQLNKRLASLTTGVAVIQVGGSSEEEIKEVKDRIDDAQWACKAALEDGYIPGGGNSLLLIAKDLDKVVTSENYDEQIGISIVKNALSAPFKTIISNAGISYSDIIGNIYNKNDFNYGYDAKNLTFTNLIEAGIIDPTKAVKGALYAASSIAFLILTSDVCITEDPVENNSESMPMMLM